MPPLKLPLTAVLAAMLFGCATNARQGASVADADQATIAGCAFAGSVSGTSGVGALAASTGINNAKNQARDQAAQLGASHIVWLSVVGGFTPNVSGSAYKCQTK